MYVEIDWSMKRKVRRTGCGQQSVVIVSGAKHGVMYYSVRGYSRNSLNDKYQWLLFLFNCRVELRLQTGSCQVII